MTALLCIDTESNRVRRYQSRRAGGAPRLTDEVTIIRPQCDTLGQQLDAFLTGAPLEYVHVEPTAA